MVEINSRRGEREEGEKMEWGTWREMNLDRRKFRRGGKRARTRRMKRESDDQVLVDLMRDAHICSRSSVIFT